MTLSTRRTFLKAAAALSMGAALSPSRILAKGDDTVRVGYLPITDATPLLIAHANGYFKEEGLHVPRPVRVRSWSTLAESFSTGKFNLTHMLLPIPVWMRFNRRAPVKVMAWDHTNGSALTVGKGSGITGFDKLGGKQIAVPFWYSMHNVILQMGLRKFGLKPVIRPQNAPLKPDEVNLFILPPPEMPAALLGRKIDGFIVAEPFNAISEMKIGARIMRFTGDIWKNHPCCVVVMHEKDSVQRPAFTQKAINAVVRAQLWVIENPEKAARILSKEGKGYLPASEKALLRVFTRYDAETYGPSNTPQAIHHPEWGIRRIGFQPYPYPSATRFITRQLRETLVEGDTGFLKRHTVDFMARDLVDDTYVKRAINSLGGPGKFDLIDIERPWDREETIEI